jgi:Na+-driven multidrug efflux pump
MERNKMGFEPIPGLITKMSLPVIFSMLIQALYNVVDSIFVSRLANKH